MDVLECHSKNLSVNSIKTHKNPVNSGFWGFSRKEDLENVMSCKIYNLQEVEAIRPRGFGPLTYGLEIRCSIQLSYGRL